MTTDMPSREVPMTAGAGHTGSDVCVVLLQSGYKVAVPNNLCKCHCAIFDRADYPTLEGTGLRDYMHVVGSGRGTCRGAAVPLRMQGLLNVSLDAGRGYSVIETVEAFEHASGMSIPYKIVNRRPGDIAERWADPTPAAASLIRRAMRDIDAMCANSWRWQKNNSNRV